MTEIYPKLKPTSVAAELIESKLVTPKTACQTSVSYFELNFSIAIWCDAFPSDVTTPERTKTDSIFSGVTYLPERPDPLIIPPNLLHCELL